MRCRFHAGAGTAVAVAVLAAMAAGLPAQQGPGTDETDVRGDTLPVLVLEPLVVEGRMDDLTGVAATASQGLVGFRDFRLRPLVREGELLEAVPGLITTQHSGDGKSNQMFVRGFNLDHGTDFSTRVEGMQVNVPSHGHGQGYTDLNFVIPELVDHVEYQLGPYYAEIGDFGSAGGAHLRLRRSLPAPLVSVGAGEGGYRRLVAAASGGVGSGDVLGGVEVKGYDGPWDLPQDLSKRAGMLRYSRESGSSVFSLLALGYDNDWNASDQIPRRLVEQGATGRFSQVDSTLGGATSRASLSATWMRISPGGSAQRLDVHGIHYDLRLHSNFTYFLDDPELGDRIRQEDERAVLGASFAHVQPLGRHTGRIGLQTRFDRADVALGRARAGAEVATVRSDRVRQWGSGVYAELESDWSDRIRTVLGLRGDWYAFDVDADLEANSGEADDGILSPKASLIFAPGPDAEVYLSGGFGFHSNDARGTVQSLDPDTREPREAVDPLVRSRGAELGLRVNPATRWRSTLTAWWVALDSELLFVGDAGTTEPSGASRRVGITWTNAYRIAPGLTADADVSLARARFEDLPAGEDRVPGALEDVVTAGLTWEPAGPGPYAALRLRRFGGYPLVEDDGVRAEGASLVNLNAGWSFGAVRVGVAVLNLLDARDADIEYFYASRLPGEPPAGVEDVHFHPVEPRMLRVTATWGL